MRVRRGPEDERVDGLTLPRTDLSSAGPRSVSSVDVARRQSANVSDERGHGLPLGRRGFIRLAAAAGIGLPGLSAIVAACDRERAGLGERSEDGRADVKALAATPPMEWNSWNVYGDDIDEAKIPAVANAMVDSGMRDVGWEYVMLDDGWQKTRGSRRSPSEKLNRKWAIRCKVSGASIGVQRPCGATGFDDVSRTPVKPSGK
jgi:hypothetical protein